MRIEELWTGLEADASSGKATKSGWLFRLAQPAQACPLLVALELASDRRAVLLRLSGAIPSRRLWPKCRGLEALAVEIEGACHFGVALKEQRYADVFTALADDLSRRIAEVSTPDERARTFLGQLARWQKFLSASLEGLSAEQQRGLWGELHFLQESLLPALGVSAVSAWKGGAATHQDFQFDNGAIEVKTTSAKQPQSVRITSERQLDDTGVGALFLQVIVVDEREVGSGGAKQGATLPEKVSALRQALASELVALDEFNDALLEAGYLDAHASRYESRKFTLRSQSIYRVRRGFPRLTERVLPKGIGDVNYALSLVACSPFLTTISSALAELSKRKRVAQATRLFRAATRRSELQKTQKKS